MKANRDDAWRGNIMTTRVDEAGVPHIFCDKYRRQYHCR